MTTPNLLGSNLIMLHGANGCGEEMQPWLDALSSDFKPVALNMIGHGGRALPERFEMPALAADVLTQMDERGMARALVFGYSFGGTLALYLARHHPDRIQGVVALAAKCVYDARTVAHLTHLLQVPRLSAMTQRNAHLTRVHHPIDWRELVPKLSDMFTRFAQAEPLSQADLAAIQTPALLVSGAQDQIVSAQETWAMQKAIGHASLAMFEGQAHPADHVPTQGLVEVMRTWAVDRLMRV